MREAPAWTAAFVGIPFRDLGRDRAGADCYGLNRLVTGELTGLWLPSYGKDYEASNDWDLVAALIDQALTADGPWRKVPWADRWDLDWVLYRNGLAPSHLALVAGPDRVFHTYRGHVAGNERVDHPPLRHAQAFVGCFRHEALEGHPALAHGIRP